MYQRYWVWWETPLIPALRRLRQEFSQFNASLMKEKQERETEIMREREREKQRDREREKKIARESLVWTEKMHELFAPFASMVSIYYYEIGEEQGETAIHRTLEKPNVLLQNYPL
jgi:hypothetical protein